MTAEIVVANKWGIAIAADSAVTASQLHKGRLRDKVVHGASKLFSLSKWHPVCVMFFNSVSLGGTPWEVLFKSARAELGKTHFPTLEGYEHHLTGYLSTSPGLYDADNVANILRSNVWGILHPHEQDNPTLDQFLTTVAGATEELEKLPRVPSFTEEFEKTIEAEHEAVLNLGHSTLADHLKPGTEGAVRRLLLAALTRQEPLSNYSGIVIAGFGHDEPMPRIRQMMADIVVAGKPRIWPTSQHRVSADQGSIILPLADAAVITTILDGVNPAFEQKQNSEALSAISGIAATIIDGIVELNEDTKTAYKNAAWNGIVQSFIDYRRRMREYVSEELRRPIESTISLLPPSDLATVAETLLNASGIHKRVNPDTETIGGPVDVAVISKGDGFVWIKRKHYFDPKLNPSFLQKYLDT